MDKLLQTLYRQIWDNVPMFLSSSPAEIRANLRTRKLTRKLLAESGGTVNEQFGTKDDAFVRALATGQIRRESGIERFEGNSVYFTGGTSFTPDLVLFCTGFETRAPFIEGPVLAAERFLNTFDPAMGPTIAFIGFVRPAFGAIPPLAELQARWFTQILSGEADLPTVEKMNESIESWHRHRRHIFRAKEDRLSHLVDYTEYCDLLAGQVGCNPHAEDLKKEGIAFRRRYTSGPFVAAQYRLTGPGAKPDIARKVIESMPLSHPWPDWINLHLRWKLCQILEWVLGPEYAPKLPFR